MVSLGPDVLTHSVYWQSAFQASEEPFQENLKLGYTRITTLVFTAASHG